MESKYELIKRTFPFLEKDLITELSESSTLYDLKPGQSLFAEGEFIKSFPMVVEGCLRVVRMSGEGNELLLYYLNRCEICTMSLTCCMGLKKSNIKAIGEEQSIVLTIPVNKPDRWMSEYRTWKEFMMYSYRKRFEELMDTIDAIAFMKLDERLVRFFKERFKSTGKTVFTGTHLDIAILLNTSREVISRLLRKLEKENLVITERNTVDYTSLVRN
jgi:CRP/FNR family transcriptional regulator